MASEPKPIEKIMKLGYVKQVRIGKTFSHRNGSEGKKTKHSIRFGQIRVNTAKNIHKWYRPIQKYCL